MKEIYKTKFERINTMPKTIEERFKEIMEKVKIPAPKTKEDAEKYHSFYVELLNFYGSEMKRIKKVVLPKLREMIK